MIGTPRVITTDLESQPVFRAWAALGPQSDGFPLPRPTALELLYQSRKSTVYRLPGVGRHAGAVIAKKCAIERARVERRVYGLLKNLRCPGIHFYGYFEVPEEHACWLFLEDASGEAFDFESPDHRRLAARWLARLHTASSRHEELKQLRDRGPEHYLEHLRIGRETLRRGQESRELSPEDLAVVDRIHRMLDHAETHWPEVAKASRDIPWCFVHADFVPKNLRIRRSRSGKISLLVFDWESSGWGLPGVDLDLTDLDTYHDRVKDHWPRLTRDDVERLAHLGTLMRGGTASIHWEATYLATGWLENIIGNMRFYDQRMTAAFEALGWPL